LIVFSGHATCPLPRPAFWGCGCCSSRDPNRARCRPDFKDLVVERIGGVDPDGKPWTAIAIHWYLKYSVNVGYSTLCRNLHEWGSSQIQPRPKAVKADPAKQAGFVRTVHRLLPKKPDLWFQDEMAFWADPAAYKVWALRGSKPSVPRLVTHEHVNVFGAVRPEDGRFYAFIASHGNATLFQHFLDQMQERIDPSRRTIMVLDNVRFHHRHDLKWGNIEPLYLPAYSPNLNPIETLWLVLKKRFFNGWIPCVNEPLEQRVTNAIGFYEQHPNLVQSACAITTYL